MNSHLTPVEQPGSQAPDQPESANKRDFVEALARGLDILTAFGPTSLAMTVSEVAAKTDLARPTARRLLLTLESLGYVRAVDGVYSLTTQVLQIGTSIIAAQGLWDVARPHMLDLVAKTGESSSMAQLDGSDIVYTARVPVPKIIALAVSIGTRFPAPVTSLGRVLMANLPTTELDELLAKPSQSGVRPRVDLTRTELNKLLNGIRQRGWSLSDELLSLGVRSIAAPVTDAEGRTVAAMNVTVHAAETSIDKLVEEYLPLLLDTTERVSTAWAHMSRIPNAEGSSDA